MLYEVITIYRVEGKLFLVDGFHRVEASEAVAKATGKYPAMIAADVTDGDIGDAIATAAIANTTNGKQMKKKEYRTSFRMLAKSGKLEGLDSRSIAEMMHYVVSHVTIWKWAREDFPGLLEAKPKKGEKPDINQERHTDDLSSQRIEHNAAISGMYQAQKLLFDGRITDAETLDDLACAAKGILEKAVELGGDPDVEPF